MQQQPQYLQTQQSVCKNVLSNFEFEFDIVLKTIGNSQHCSNRALEMEWRYTSETQFEIPLATEMNQDAQDFRGNRDGHLFSIRGRRMRSNDNLPLSNFANWFPKGHRFQRPNGNHFHQNFGSQGISMGVSQFFRRPNMFGQEAKCTENALQPGSPIESPLSAQSNSSDVMPVDGNTSSASSDPERIVGQPRFTLRTQHEPRADSGMCFECSDIENVRGPEATHFREKRLGLQLPLLSNGRPLEDLLLLRNRNQINSSRFQKPFSNGIRNGASRFVGKLPTFHSSDHTNQSNQENPGSSNENISPTSRRRNFFTSDAPFQPDSDENTGCNIHPKSSPIRQALARRLALRKKAGLESELQRSRSWGSAGFQHKPEEELGDRKGNENTIRRLKKNIQQLKSTLFEMEHRVSDRETELQNMKHEMKNRMETLFRRVDQLQLYQDVEYRRFAYTVGENERNFTELDRQMDYALAVLGSGRRSPGLSGHFKAIYNILKNRMWNASFKVLGIIISVYAQVRDAFEDLT